jgi:hypothetical protein
VKLKENARAFLDGTTLAVFARKPIPDTRRKSK